MRVLIIGAGAVGVAIGASLRCSGAEVDFIARGETKAAIEAGGISRHGMFSNIDIVKGQVGLYDDFQDLPENVYDYVIIATKTTANYQVAESLNSVSDCMKDSGVIVFMQNGMGYEAPFFEYFTQEEIYHSRVITGFVKDAPNVVNITAHQAPILFGSIYGCDNEVVAPLADAINKSGLPAGVEDEISKQLWAKFIYNTTLNPLSAILNMSYGELAESDYAHSIMDILIEETFEVIKASGSKTYWNNADEYREALFGEIIPVTGQHRSSTLQDIRKKQKTEIDTLTGSLLSVASQCNVAVPVHSMMYSLVKAMEEKF